jgi:predicted acylesterase/phospholipase RssA
VLKKLEEQIGDFPYHVRLITGASGGMLGAAYYVSTLPPPGDGLRPRRAPDELQMMVDRVSSDHLTRIANQLAFSDIPSLLWPLPWGTDRGEALEDTWYRNTQRDARLPRQSSPLYRSIRQLAVGEWQGWRPSLVFTPMFVEDGRRLVVSNLSIPYVPRNVGHVLFARGTDKLSRSTKQARSYLRTTQGDQDIYSLSALEFYRVFPEAHDFLLSTAVRMSAAFPLVTPAISIPTVPPRRVVDAGYYDNYGVNLGAMWIFENRRWLYEYTSGVVLIQIRDSQSERGRREIEDPEPEPERGIISTVLRRMPFSSRTLDVFGKLSESVRRGSQWITSPLEGLSTARQANMSFRNDEQAEILNNVINLDPESPVTNQGFYTTVVFECPKEASLSWALTPQEKRDIQNGFEPNRTDPAYSDNARRNAERLRLLLRWWNR